MRRAIQSQNDEIGIKSVRGQQDLFTGLPELDHKFKFACHRGLLRSLFPEQAVLDLYFARD